ncbi:MAG: nucleoside monophosphate kinase [Candidatus Paceibacterota bacterium]
MKINKIKKVYLLYGPPASGKTTIISFLAKKLNASPISMGEITRREILAKTKLGKKLKIFLDKVIEYSPNLLREIFDKEIKKASLNKNFIFDGFPKYLREIKIFLEIIKNNKFIIEDVIIINLSLEDSLKRVKNRRICSSCLKQQNIYKKNNNKCLKCGGKLKIRDDDKSFIIKRRYNDFLISQNNIIEELKKVAKNIFYLNSNQSPLKIKKDINKIYEMPE